MTDKIGDKRVDHFWSKVFELRGVTGKGRYPALQKVVTASLAIAHRNADMERGLSDQTTREWCQWRKLRCRLITPSVFELHRMQSDSMIQKIPSMKLLLNFQNKNTCTYFLVQA